MSVRARSWVYRPHDAAEAAEAVADARERGLTIAHRGAGQSYGDAALNEGGAVLDCSGLGRILAFDREAGTVRAEAGVTIGQLWEHVLPAGFWPPVVPGTMAVTLGGATAMNIHGKNAFRVGPFGEHVEALTLLGPDGAVRELRREPVGGPVAEWVRAADAPDTAAQPAPATGPLRLADVIGAQGLNGTILDVTLHLKRVASGFLQVTPAPVRALGEALALQDEAARTHDYAVGWIDCFAGGGGLGRGALHWADHLPPDHRLAGKGLDPAKQRLPDRIMGIVPKRHTWRALKPFNNAFGMRAMNAAKQWAGVAQGRRPYIQSHAAFHFLLDYVPDWKRVYRPHGLMQYQLFVPCADAERVLGEALRLQQRLGVVSHLGVLKRHRPDAFAASYAVDGYSLALDFPIRPRRMAAMRELFREFDRLLEACGGRIYAAKDQVSVGRLPERRDAAYGTDLARRWEAGALAR
jgi:FAD/FMN-containing dehydrogenase